MKLSFDLPDHLTPGFTAARERYNPDLIGKTVEVAMAEETV